MKKRPPKQPVYKILHQQASVHEQNRQQRIAETRAAEMRVRFVHPPKRPSATLE